jgi:hypothetical protein
VELVHVGVRSLSMSLKLTVVLLWWTGSFFMFMLFKRLGWLPGAIAALFFALAPYLIVDVFVRAAYPELAAIAFVPGVLWSLDSFARTGRLIFVPLFSLLTCLMLLCHLPTCFVFGPVVAVYFYCLPRGPGARFRVMVTVVAGVLGLGLATFYVLPALGELHLVRMNALTTQYFDYHRHFVDPSQWVNYAWGYGGSVEGPADQMSFQIGISQWIAVVVAGLAVGAAWTSGRIAGTHRELVFWLSVIGCSMFLMTRSSLAVWEAVPPLRYLQFPWRFLMVIAVACGALAAHLLSLLNDPARQACVVIGVVALQFGLFHGHLEPARYIAQDDMNIDSRQWRGDPKARSTAFIEDGYFPIAAARLPDDDVARWSVSRGQGDVDAVTLRDDRLVLGTTSEQGFQLTVNSHFFPGWKAWLDGREVAVDVRRGDGYMSVEVPGGTHRVEIAFEDTPTRRAANWTSIASGVGYLVLSAACLTSARGRVET